MNHQKQSSSMWWMIIGCIVLFVGLFFFRNQLPAQFLWPILIIGCLLMHVFMMRGHGTHTANHDKTLNTLEQKKKDDSQPGHHGGCCG